MTHNDKRKKAEKEKLEKKGNTSRVQYCKRYRENIEKGQIILYRPSL